MAKNSNNSTLGRHIGLHSLRGRYILVAILVLAFVSISAIINQYFVSEITQHSTSHIQLRNKVIQQGRQIRNEAWQAEYALFSFLQYPKQETRHDLYQHLDLAIKYSEELGHVTWPNRIEGRKHVANLKNNLLLLRKDSESLINIRTDVRERFPAMRIMEDEMVHTNTNFTSAITQALNELESQKTSTAKLRLYSLYTDIRHGWMMMINSFRTYISSRMGAFGDPELNRIAQAENVEVLHSHTLDQLKQLGEYQKNHGLGFEGEEAFKNMQQYVREWYQSYQKVRTIVDSEDWRADLSFVRQHIYPTLNEIHDQLSILGNKMEESARNDLISTYTIVDDIHGAQLLTAIIILLLIATGFYYFNKSVLQPIAQLADAIKDASLGKSSFDLPKVRTKETKQLIDAFTHMHDEVQRRQKDLEYQAMHDALTKLPNRSLLQDRIDHAISAAKRDKQTLALIMLDLDRFKEINDTLGHHIGDAVLQVISSRLQKLLRKSDTIARLGGDEFAILLENTDLDQTRAIAEKISLSLEEEMDINNHKLHTSGSLGIAIFPIHGNDASTLTQKADVAMYMAKRSNEPFTFYDVTQDTHSIAKLALINDLHKAVEQGSLMLYFQPKIDIYTRQITGAEALLRWNHPERGFIPPDEVIALAEYTGTIKALTVWVLNAALQQCKSWRSMGLEIGVSVNLSVWNLQDKNLVQLISGCLEELALPTDSLYLEITESAMMADPERSEETLRQLDNMGIKLSVDDFGTGFSSLGYLKRLPVDELKIDKSFVFNMTENDNDAIIVRSTIDLAHNLGLKVVAEGIENEDVMEILYVLGCDTAQGYHISRPLPPDEFINWAHEYQLQHSADTSKLQRQVL